MGETRCPGFRFTAYNEMMKSILFAFLLQLAAASTVQAQGVYCKQFGNKTWCNNGMLVHQFGGTTVIPDVAPLAPRAPLLPHGGGILRNNDLPTLAVPYSAAGTQNRLGDYGVLVPAAPAAVLVPAAPAAAPVLVVPATSGARVCHQFGTTLVCN